MNKLITAVCLIVLGIAIGANSHQGPFSHPCETEDSNSCYWDATARGNGLGRSFVTDSTGTVYYQRAN